MWIATSAATFFYERYTTTRQRTFNRKHVVTDDGSGNQEAVSLSSFSLKVFSEPKSWAFVSNTGIVWARKFGATHHTTQASNIFTILIIQISQFIHTHTSSVPSIYVKMCAKWQINSNDLQDLFVCEAVWMGRFCCTTYVTRKIYSFTICT